jgi:S-adenosylmethionine:tRNA ribosyltransferase-isomerase
MINSPARPLDFALPPELEAAAPPEERGVGRDDVRLMTSYRSNGRIEHHRFPELPDLLLPGDLLVVNTSATIPAALHGFVLDQPAVLHLSARRDDGSWIVELRHRDADNGSSTPWLDARPNTVVLLPARGRAILRAPALATAAGETRLWSAELDMPWSAREYLAEHGRPIRYSHVGVDRPIGAYQSVFASDPGSAEMPSASRPFTAEIVTRLVARGVGITPVLLHCGVSSLEAHEPPLPERFRVSAQAAERVNATHRLGGRIIAVGTTVVRALESAAVACGLVLPTDGWTELVLRSDHELRVVDGVLTGWHEPRASHLMLLEAVAGRALLEASYRAALDGGYLWHEFGDCHLILP